jgi:hypothetical protein
MLKAFLIDPDMTLGNKHVSMRQNAIWISEGLVNMSLLSTSQERFGGRGILHPVPALIFNRMSLWAVCFVIFWKLLCAGLWIHFQGKLKKKKGVWRPATLWNRAEMGHHRSWQESWLYNKQKLVVCIQTFAMFEIVYIRTPVRWNLKFKLFQNSKCLAKGLYRAHQVKLATQSLPNAKCAQISNCSIDRFSRKGQTGTKHAQDPWMRSSCHDFHMSACVKLCGHMYIYIYVSWTEFPDDDRFKIYRVYRKLKLSSALVINNI